MERIPLISLLGPEGSGKSTQAKLLAKHLNLPYVSTGDLIRDAKDSDPGEVGEACRVMYAAKTYLPGRILLRMLANRFQKDDTKNGLVLDGGFRTWEETENFPAMLETVDRNFAIKVVFLRIPGWQSVDRLLKRNRGNDDTPEGILSRLKPFYTDLGKRTNFIKNRWNFAIVMAANKSIEDLNKEIMNLPNLC